MTGRPTASEELRSHWTLILAAGIGFSFMSLMVPTLGVFMGPLSEKFGWSRAEFTMGVSINGVMALLLSPFVGAAIDRWGTRRLALPGLALTAAATAAFGFANGSVTQWLLLWLAWGLSAMLIQATVWSTAVASVFEAGKGFALGLTLSGTAFAQVVAPPLTNWLLTAYGWRVAYFSLGLGWGSIALILSALFLRSAHETNHPRSTTRDSALAAADLPGLTIREAWRSTSLWRVAIATFLILLITIAVSVHQIPILEKAGVSPSTAAWLASLSGIAGIVGKLVTGALIDRFPVRWIGGLTLAATAVAYPLLMRSGGAPALIVVACMISGYAAGTKIQLCGYLTARYAGMRHYGTIFGVMGSLIALSSALGPLLASNVYDAYGNYDAMLIVGTAISLISGLLIFSLGKYPDWTTQPASPEPG